MYFYVNFFFLVKLKNSFKLKLRLSHFWVDYTYILVTIYFLFKYIYVLLLCMDIFTYYSDIFLLNNVIMEVE